MIVLVNQLIDGFRYGPNAAIRNGAIDSEDWQFEPNDETNENLQGLDDTSGFPDLSNFTKHLWSNALEKRNGHSVRHNTCSCDSKPDRTFLGEGVYPRNYISRVCDWDKIAQRETICRFGGKCKEFYHKVLVLKTRNDLTVLPENSHDLPRKIKQDFYFDTHVSLHIILTTYLVFSRPIIQLQEVSIDCRCSF